MHEELQLDYCCVRRYSSACDITIHRVRCDHMISGTKFIVA